MTPLFSGCAAMSKKDDEHISPYLRRRLRSYEEVQRERADHGTRPDRQKSPTSGVSRDPGKGKSRDDQVDR